ncbi:MAG: polyprenyl synthetase family protein [Peptococcaceae bacterium]|nr:polyprenyl synthetase family protein [Peptococcaceae bacterium]
MKNLMQQKKIKKILKDVEAELEQLVHFDDPFIRECALSTIQAGGKRLRPIFVILTAQYFGRKDAEIVKFASIMELVHTASLIHDDVNDHSDLRRGKTTINARHGNNVAVHIGVYMLIEALLKVYEVSHAKELLKILTHTAVEMSRGEVAQLASMYDTAQTIDSYNYRIERKTALLIASCCQTGAILSDATPEEVDAFYRFGHHLGMAFQIKDDMMDILPSDKEIGKPIGHDLENGLINLPTILLLQKEFPEKEEIITRIQNRFPNGKADFDFIMPFVLQDDIVKACEEAILYHIDAAKAILDNFDENETRALLYQSADYIYERSI